ncbi:MAG: hypothetical protein RRY05_09700 [Bacteroidales bacterium]
MKKINDIKSSDISEEEATSIALAAIRESQNCLNDILASKGCDYRLDVMFTYKLR